MAQDKTKYKRTSNFRHWLALLPLVIVTLFFFVLSFNSNRAAWDIPLLLPFLNTVFMGTISCLVLGLFLWQVKRIGSWQILLWVNGLVVYGIACLAAGWAFPAGGQNLAMTIHNSGTLVASISLSIGSIILILNNSSTLRPQPGSRSFIVLGVTLSLMAILIILAFRGVLPPYFPPGAPPAILRQVIVIVSCLLFIKSTVIVFIAYHRSKVTFLFWYASGLLMITLGLLVLPFLVGVLDPLTWLGRILQYTGCVYMGIALYVLARTSRTRQSPLAQVLDEFLAQSKVNYQLLVDSLDDAIILVDSWGRILSWNRAAEQIFGYSYSQALGENVADFIFDRYQKNEFRPDLLTFLGITSGNISPNIKIDGTARRKNGQVFACELVVTQSRSATVRNNAAAFTLVIRDVSERQKNQAALEASEARFRLALSHAPVSIAAQDRNLQFLWAYNRSPYQPSNVVGKTDYSFYAKENADRLSLLKRKVLDNGIAYREQLWLNNNDEKMFVDLYLEPIKDSTNQVKGVASAMVDLTQWKNAEEALRLNNERLHILSESGKLLFSTESPETIVQTIAGKVMAYLKCDCFFNFLVNKKAARLYLNSYSGISASEAARLESIEFESSMCGLVAQTGRRCVIDDVQHNDDYKLSTIRSFGVQAYACFPLQIRGGNSGTLSFGTRTRTAFKEDEVNFMSAISSQVSIALERQFIAESLRQNEEMFRSLAENSLDIISRFDTEGRYLYINPAGLKNVRQGEKAYLGKTLSEVGAPPEFVALWKAKQQEVLNSGKPAFIEHSHFKDDEELFYQTLLAPELAADGSIKSIISSTRDITDLKRMEKLKDEFIGMVSHELKTPLTVIIGSLAVAKTKGLPIEQVNELLTDAASYADDLVVIVDNLLELSRFQSNRLTIQTEPTDLSLIARTVIQKLKNKSGKHKLIVAIPPNTAKINIDKVRIERVLYNLVENAIKYSPTGGEVRVFQNLREGVIQIGVSDQGLGIAAEDIPRLFQRFERIEAYEKHIIPGLGLGLRVCRILVEAHGGKIWVESTPGRGSTFFFTVPLVH